MLTREEERLLAEAREHFTRVFKEYARAGFKADYGCGDEEFEELWRKMIGSDRTEEKPAGKVVGGADEGRRAE